MSKQSKILFNIIMVLAIICLTVATVPKTLQEDTFYMVKVGEYICQNGMHVIDERIEPFAWVDGLIYTYPHWLLDVTFYQIHRVFDFMGIYIFTLLIGIITYILIYFTNLKVCKNHLISAIITLVAIFTLAGFIAARAQIITFLCLVLEILFIEKFLETGHKRWAIGLILDPILLANCHAALFPIYFVVFLPYIAEWVWAYIFNRKNYYEERCKRVEKKIEKFQYKIEKGGDKGALEAKISIQQSILKELKEKYKEAEEKQNVKDKFRNKDRKIIIERNKYLKWLIVIFVICIFTGLLTPIKDIPYTYMWKSIEGNTMDFISEHQPVVLINDYNLFIILAVIVIFIFSNKVKLKLSDLFMLMGMTVLSLISYKQFPIFFICAMCPVNKMITMWRNTRKLEKAQEKEYIVNLNKEELENTNYDEIAETLADSDVSEKKRRKNQTKNGLERAKKIINKIPSKILTVKGSIYIILITIIISLLGYRYIVGTDLIDKSNYPVAAADWMLENLDVKNIKLFNDFNYGSYLLYRGIPVFIDGRADVYDPVFNGRSDDSYLAYMLGSSLQLWYEDVFFTYNITHVITYVNSNLNQVMERGISYNMIYNDGTFVIYEINMQLLIDQGIIKVDDAQNQSQTADQTIEDTTEAVTE